MPGQSPGARELEQPKTCLRSFAKATRTIADEALRGSIDIDYYALCILYGHNPRLSSASASSDVSKFIYD